MKSGVPPDVVFAFSAYSTILWLTIAVLLAVLYYFARPIVSLVHGKIGKNIPGQARLVCARSSFFLAAFSLSPVMASLLGLPYVTALIFVPAFIAMGLVLKRSVANWPLIALTGFICVQTILDLSFFMHAMDYADVFSSLADFLLFKGQSDPENAFHYFLFMPIDIALLFHFTKTIMDVVALLPTTLALREGGGE